jgi:ABC-type multidrug transport system fused ATPase/permease subunit
MKYIKNKNLYLTLLEIFSFLEIKRKKQFIVIILLSFITSILEVATLGALVPFLKIILDNSVLNFREGNFFYISQIFNINTPTKSIIFFSTVFIFFSLLSGFLRIYLLSYSIKLANLAGADIGSEVYRKTLFQSYQVHTKEGSSFVISGIVKKIQDVTISLFSVVNFFSSILIFLSIFFFIVYIDPTLILTSIIFFSLIFILFSIIIKKKLILNSEKISKEQNAIIKSLQEGLGSIRDVLLNQSQDSYIKIYKSSISNLNKSNGENEFLNQLPKLFIETVVIVFIGLLILVLSFLERSLTSSLTSVGILILGSQKMLPLLNKIYVSWSTLLGRKRGLEDIFFLLSKRIETTINDSNSLFSINSIEFRNVNFKYDTSSSYVFKNLNIFWEKKKRIGIAGKTGSGKSTFLDLLTGLLKPSNGEIFVGGKILNHQTDNSWKKQLSYISQQIYLSDSSILNNIAISDQFGVIDRVRAENCAKRVKIHDFIISNGGYEVLVGERGVRLSGGQKQKIGIARALYKKSNLIIFDESTSALDSQSENEVLQSIYELNKDIMIIIVSHRSSTLKNCDEIYEVKERKLVKIS